MGAIAGIGAAICWAGAGLLIKPVSTRFSSLSLNSIRVLAGWIFLMVILSPLGKVAEMGNVPVSSVAYLMGSGVVGLAIGSTFFIRSLSLTNITRVYPVTYSFWLLGTVVIAAIFLGEAITSFTILGAVLIVSGIVILARPSREQQVANTGAGTPQGMSGIALAVGAGICWAAGSTLVKLGLSGTSPPVVNMLRLPAVALILVALVAWREGPATFSKYDWKSLLQISGAGVLEQGMGAVLWFMSIELTGVAKATILANTSPLFVIPFAIITMKEKVAPRVILGTVFCVFGIWLTVL
ncbi:MAG: DMT family transporter [Dehalococcoidia bacterium]